MPLNIFSVGSERADPSRRLQTILDRSATRMRRKPFDGIKDIHRKPAIDERHAKHFGAHVWSPPRGPRAVGRYHHGTHTRLRSAAGDRFSDKTILDRYHVTRYLKMARMVREETL
jgi:hypothetical protein